MVCTKLNNSAFILNMVTVFYLFTFQLINPPKRRIVYLYKLFQSLISFIKKASIMIFNLFPPPNLNLNMQILNK